MHSSVQQFSVLSQASGRSSESLHDLFQQMEKQYLNRSEMFSTHSDEKEISSIASRSMDITQPFFPPHVSTLSLRVNNGNEPGDLARLLKGPHIEEFKLSIDQEIAKAHRRWLNKQEEIKLKQDAYRESLRKRLQDLKTNESFHSKQDKSDQVTRSHEEKVLKLEEEIQRLMIQRSNRGIHLSQCGIRNRQDVEQQVRGSECNHYLSNVAENRSKILRLEKERERQSSREGVLQDQINHLQSVYENLQKNQEYYRKETEKYKTRVSLKIQQRDLVFADYENIRNRVNQLVEQKKNFHTQGLKEFNEIASERLEKIKKVFNRQLEQNQKSVNESLAARHSVDEECIQSYEQVKRNHVEQIESIRNEHIQALNALLSQYWTYVDQTTFCIKSRRYQEYLYAALFRKDSDRRWVFTWKDQNTMVYQTVWDLKQSAAGIFCIHNKNNNNERLFASDQKMSLFPRYIEEYPFNSKSKLVFTWRIDQEISNGYWKLIPVGGGNVYKIFNTAHKGYLFPGNDKDLARPDDTLRRQVYIKKDESYTGHVDENPGEDCYWEITEAPNLILIEEKPSPPPPRKGGFDRPFAWT